MALFGKRQDAASTFGLVARIRHRKDAKRGIRCGPNLSGPPTIPRDPVAGQNQIGDQIRFDTEPHEPGDEFLAADDKAYGCLL